MADMTAASSAGSEQATAADDRHVQTLPRAGTIGERLDAGRRRWADITPTSSWGTTMSTREFLRFGEAAAAAAPRPEDQAEREQEFDGEDLFGLTLSGDQDSDEGPPEAAGPQPACGAGGSMCGASGSVPAPAHCSASVPGSPGEPAGGEAAEPQRGGSHSASASAAPALAAEGNGAQTPQWSAGASLHAEGQCKPCGFYWRSMGCKDGAACRHCHLCTVESTKERRKSRKEAMKQARRDSRRAAAS